MEFLELGPILQVWEAFWDTWDTQVRHGDHLDSALVCRINISAMVLFTAWNRLVPLAIAAFRYAMVCHAVAVHNHGGEKKVIDIFQCFQSCFRSCCKHKLSFEVWRILVTTMSLVSVTLCILVMIDPDVSHFYLTCLGREELFRYQFCIELCFSV